MGCWDLSWVRQVQGKNLIPCTISRYHFFQSSAPAVSVLSKPSGYWRLFLAKIDPITQIRYYSAWGHLVFHQQCTRSHAVSGISLSTLYLRLICFSMKPYFFQMRMGVTLVLLRFRIKKLGAREIALRVEGPSRHVQESGFNPWHWTTFLEPLLWRSTDKIIKSNKTNTSILNLHMYRSYWKYFN